MSCFEHCCFDCIYFVCAGWLQEEQPGKQPSDQEQRRMTAEQVAEAIRNGDMVHDRV